jgi:hypothetical protein
VQVKNAPSELLALNSLFKKKRRKSEMWGFFNPFPANCMIKSILLRCKLHPVKLAPFTWSDSLFNGPGLAWLPQHKTLLGGRHPLTNNPSLLKAW